jgi:hypothetical protein
MDHVSLLVEAAVCSSNAARLLEQAAVATEGGGDLGGASGAAEILEAPAAPRRPWRRTSCIGHRVLMPRPPVTAPPASLLGRGAEVPAPKKRPAPPAGAPPRRPAPPSGPPPEAILWAAMVASMPSADLTVDRLLGIPAVPAAVVDQGGKGKAKPIGAKASKAAVVDKGSKEAARAITSTARLEGKACGKGKGKNKNKHG